MNPSSSAASADRVAVPPAGPAAASALPGGTSIGLSFDARLSYLLRLGDTALIHAQRLSEWCGHGPILEEDIALTNAALDMLGQARAVLSHAGSLTGFDEDQLAFLRDERDFRNMTLAELPLRRGGGDFADTVLRHLLLATWFRRTWQRIASGSTDAELAAIAGKAVKESRYHEGHAAEWVVRLGDGTDESARRLRAAVARAWPYVAELLHGDEVDEEARRTGLGPARDEVAEDCLAAWRAVFAEAGLDVPPIGAFRSTGSRGVHSEAMGPLLAEMQVLPRTYPGGAW